MRRHARGAGQVDSDSFTHNTWILSAHGVAPQGGRCDCRWDVRQPNDEVVLHITWNEKAMMIELKTLFIAGILEEFYPQNNIHSFNIHTFAPVWSDPVRISPRSLASKKFLHGLLCGFVCMILRLAILIQYRSVTDRQTDRHVTVTAYTALA